MEEKEGKCFLCGHDANIQSEIDNGANIRILCPRCPKPYRVSHGAIQYYFKRPNGKQLLDTKAKKKLITGIEKAESEILLCVKKIEELTGVKSVHENI